MHVDRLQQSVDLAFLLWQLCEIPLGCRRQSLDDIFQRVAERAVEQVEDQHRDFGVGQEQGTNIVLRQIGTNRGVVGEIAIVHECLVQPDKWMGPTRMPHSAFGRVTVMTDPDMSSQVLKAVGVKDILSVTD